MAVQAKFPPALEPQPRLQRTGVGNDDTPVIEPIKALCPFVFLKFLRMSVSCGPGATHPHWWVC